VINPTEHSRIGDEQSDMANTSKPRPVIKRKVDHPQDMDSSARPPKRTCKAIGQFNVEKMSFVVRPKMPYERLDVKKSLIVKLKVPYERLDVKKSLIVKLKMAPSGEPFFGAKAALEGRGQPTPDPATTQNSNFPDAVKPERGYRYISQAEVALGLGLDEFQLKKLTVNLKDELMSRDLLGTMTLKMGQYQDPKNYTVMKLNDALNSVKGALLLTMLGGPFWEMPARLDFYIWQQAVWVNKGK